MLQETNKGRGDSTQPHTSHMFSGNCKSKCQRDAIHSAAHQDGNVGSHPWAQQKLGRMGSNKHNCSLQEMQTGTALEKTAWYYNFFFFINFQSSMRCYRFHHDIFINLFDYSVLFLSFLTLLSLILLPYRLAPFLPSAPPS